MTKELPVELPTGLPRPFASLAVGLPWLLASVCVCVLALQFFLAQRIVINWDEFYFLARVHEHLRGDLADRFQSLHVQLFAPLARLGGSEIDRIVAGRLVMAACLAGSSLLLYAIVRRFAQRDAALFGVLAYLSLTVVAEHGASFRADPLVTLLSLLAVWLLLALPNRMVGAALAGITMAVAALVTIKIVFYLVAIAAVLLCLAAGVREFIRLALAFGVPFLGAAVALYLLHDATLAAAHPGNAAAAAGGGTLDAILRFVDRVAAKMFVEDGLFPRWQEFLILVALNPIFWFMTVGGTIAAVRGARSGARSNWLKLAIALPLLAPIVYRNAFFYFYVFILPPAALLIALSYETYRARLLARSPRALRTMATIVVVALLVSLAANYGRQLPDRLAPQRTTVAAVHRVFPEPVPYIDGFRVVASFPHAGFFMSSWGMDQYHATGNPVFADLVAETQPPLLLADSPSLYAALVPDFETTEARRLLPADAQFLSDHYLQYWGMLFVAGKRFAVPAGGARDGFTIAVTGDYRLEGAGLVRIDGRGFMPGDIVPLSAGTHAFETDGTAAASEYRLVWAAAGPVPDEKPVDLLTFFGFERTSERE